jgi:hypothetical protein
MLPNTKHQFLEHIVRSFKSGIAILLITFLVDCTPPYPTRKHSAGPSGAIVSLPNPSSVKAGTATRQDVVTAFKQVDTGVSSPWFFWGRWKSSSFALSAVTDSGVEEIPIWSATNLLVEFDEAGTVKRSQTLSDKRIIAELQRILAEHPQPTSEMAPFDVEATLSTPSHRACECIIKLSTTVEFSAKQGGIYFPKCPVGLTAPIQQFTVTAFKSPVDEFDPGQMRWIRVTLHFSQRTAFGTDIPATLRVNDLVSLLSWLGGAPRPDVRP